MLLLCRGPLFDVLEEICCATFLRFHHLFTNFTPHIGLFRVRLRESKPWPYTTEVTFPFFGTISSSISVTFAGSIPHMYPVLVCYSSISHAQTNIDRSLFMIQRQSSWWGGCVYYTCHVKIAGSQGNIKLDAEI